MISIAILVDFNDFESISTILVVISIDFEKISTDLGNDVNESGATPNDFGSDLSDCKVLRMILKAISYDFKWFHGTSLITDDLLGDSNGFKRFREKF